MDVNFILALCVAFLGIFIGFVLAIYTKEELKDGKKYFLFLQKFLLSLMFFLLLYIFNLQFIINLFLSLIFFVLLLYKGSPNQQIVYALIAILFSISSCKSSVFPMMGTLVFLYGLPTGTLLTHGMIKKKKSEIIFNLFKIIIWLPVVAIILFYLNFFTTILC
ncbi:hypothetical protein HQ529_04025 [Candidatus Woesearchaeota archaeon]|nr:hypothetical protein [Candidatus Woesearchaeota archaeon]